VFWSGSACAYPVNQQSSTEVTSLPEDLAWQGQPEEGYGEEKLTSESLFRYLREDRGITTHVARFHNVYGPRGSWNDGREKAPAAICRKVAEAKLAGNHTITIWGDGTRTRSFMYIDDCIEGIRRIMESEVYGPINLGSEEQVSIRELVEIVADIAGIKVEIECDMTRPQGVAGRNSDNTMIREKLGWEPKIPLREGLEKTYTWIEQKVKDGFKRWPTV
jgi:nucleoside-diphosphate-sugar epimerase